MTLTATVRRVVASVFFSPNANFAANSMAVLVVTYPNSGGGGSDPGQTCTDDIGNTWTARNILKYDPGPANQGFMHRVWTTSQNVGPLLTTSVITLDTNDDRIVLWEVACGVGATISYVTGGTGTAGSGGTPTVTTGSIPAGDMVIGGGSGTAGSATPLSVASQYKVVTGTGTQTYNPTVNASQVWTGDSDTTNGSWSTLQTNTGGSTLTGSGVSWIQLHEDAAAGGDDPMPYLGGGYYGSPFASLRRLWQGWRPTREGLLLPA